MNLAAVLLSVEAAKRSARSALPDAPVREERRRRWWPIRRARSQ
ncbi:hypothetical protein J2S41_003358 [Catenuloplanes atrovinosus]|uniref:Uncharacterized protein n=1 Tax=Catenuloplanes atrovinosus TaxID=137266 RepID=A0AAE3YQ55_9ACTN|nr:hypothetical protein [Catenuloplanes atrovinosus]